MIDRRTALTVLAGAAVGGSALASLVPGKPAADDAGLRRRSLAAHAKRRGMSFGAMMTAPMLASPDNARLVADQCDTIVPGHELKWGMIEKVRGQPDYTGAERIAAFARANGLALRGHTAFWYRNIPRWAPPLLAAPDAPDRIVAHVAAIVGRWKGRVVEWDVVNEAVEPRDGLPGGMRRVPFGRATDAGWIADCFHAARDADPAARLYYNDYGLEYDYKAEDDRRRAVLGLLADLKKRGAPVDGLGLQSHIRVGPPFDAGIYRAFLGEAAALGLALRLTEFDVGMRDPRDAADTDRRVADHARQVLDAAFDEPATQGMLCWGLIDRDSYAREDARAAGRDGSVQRPLPYDDRPAPKPLWDAIARALEGARPR